MEPCDLPAKTALELIRQGRMSAERVMQSCLERIESREPTLQAMAHVHASEALAEARASDPSSLLAGLPFGVKDVIDTIQMPTQYGSPIWTGHQPKADAACVAWAREAGGIVLGKCHTTEFAVRHPGPTTNPYNPLHTPGGSSSGSAAGVAAGYFPFAVATQTAGSTIRPAAFCGVVGYKPSFGLVPRMGMKIMSEGLDTIGAIGRTVSDCALLVSAMARQPFVDPDTDSGTPVIAVCRTPAWNDASLETQALIGRVAARICEASGRPVEQRELPESFAPLTQWHSQQQYSQSALSMGWEWNNRREELSPALRELLSEGLSHDASVVRHAALGLQSLRNAFDDLMRGVDVLLTPSAAGEAPAGLDSTGRAMFNTRWSALHGPAVTIPAGKGPNGLPLGIQLVGTRGSDQKVLAAAAWVERLLKE